MHKALLLVCSLGPTSPVRTHILAGLWGVECVTDSQWTPILLWQGPVPDMPSIYRVTLRTQSRVYSVESRRSSTSTSTSTITSTSAAAKIANGRLYAAEALACDSSPVPVCILLADLPFVSSVVHGMWQWQPVGIYTTGGVWGPRNHQDFCWSVALSLILLTHSLIHPSTHSPKLLPRAQRFDSPFPARPCPRLPCRALRCRLGRITSADRGPLTAPANANASANANANVP